MKKTLSVLLALCLCLSLGCMAFASGEPSSAPGGEEGLTLINSKEGKSEPYGMNTYYEKILSADDLEALDEASIVVYEDAGAVDVGAPTIHGDYSYTTASGVTHLLAPMDKVVILTAGDYAQDFAAAEGERVLVALENGANLTGTLTNVSLSIDYGATWTMTGNSTLQGLDCGRYTVYNCIFGNGFHGTYDAEYALSADTRYWTEHTADAIVDGTAYLDDPDVTFEDLYTGRAQLKEDSYLMSVFPQPLEDISTAAYVADGDDVTVNTSADIHKSGSVTENYASGKTVDYTTYIEADPVAEGMENVYVSGIRATNGASLEMDGVYVNQLSKTTVSGEPVTYDGNSHSSNAVMRYGDDSIVWAINDAVISLKDFAMTGMHDGAYATYGGVVFLQDGFIETSSNHGVQICYDGAIILKNVDVITTGSQGSALSSDHGGGYVYAENVYAYACLPKSNEASREGSGSAGLYLDGYSYFVIKDSVVGSVGDNAVTSAGGGTLLAYNTTFKGGTSYENMPCIKTHPMGNNTDRAQDIRLTDCILTATGPAFFFDGRSTDITLSGVIDCTGVEGALVRSVQMDGGNAYMGGLTLDQAYPIPTNHSTLTLDACELLGASDIVLEPVAAGVEEQTLAVTITNGTDFAGAMNGGVIDVTLSGGSSWTVTGDTDIDSLTVEPGSSVIVAEGVTLLVGGEAYPGNAASGEASGEAGSDASGYPHFDEYRDYVAALVLADDFMSSTAAYDDTYTAETPYSTPFIDIDPVIGALDYPDWMAVNYPGEAFPAA
mgnify:CR=1 FL=1